MMQIATIIAVYVDWRFAKVRGIGWRWAGFIWAYSVVTYFPLDLLKFGIRRVLSGKASCGGTTDQHKNENDLDDHDLRELSETAELEMRQVEK